MAQRPRIVIKLGSSTVTGDAGRLDLGYLASFADQVVQLRAKGFDPVVVSSGAIATGIEVLGLAARPREMSDLQAVAAVGQVRMVGTYARLFAEREVTVGQVLLTRHDTAHRQQYLYACQTLERLLAMGALPIVNENDTTAVEEIRFGDNDTLAALVGIMVGAELVILLSDIDGVYDANPRTEQDAHLVGRVDEVTDDLLAAASGTGSDIGTGGMVTKIEAARVLMKAGIPMVVADGHRPGVLVDAAAGDPVGTYFAAGTESIAGRKLWIAYARTPSGTITIDDGARAAVLERGTSLLPAGVVGLSGDFRQGDTVEIIDLTGAPLARGVAGIGAADLGRIKGMRSAQIGATMPGVEGVEVVHRDHLVIL